MAGYALVVDLSQEMRSIPDIQNFAECVARYKYLDRTIARASGNKIEGAKLDSPSSLHRGVIFDRKTGSWLLAAGTLIYGEDPPEMDLSSLLRDFLLHGESVLRDCDGLFSAVIYDGLTKAISVITDPFGYFSVFYGIHNGVAFVATSALAVAEMTQSEPDEAGVNCFLLTGKVLGDKTLWRDVKRMAAARVYKFVEGGVKESVYWEPSTDEKISKLSFSDSIESSMEVCQRAFRRNLSQERKVWADLTGGFDTRLMTMILDLSGVPFKANSVGPPNHPDVKIAQKIAETLGWEFEHFDLPENWPQICYEYFQEALGRGDAHINIFLLAKTLWVHKQEHTQYKTLLSGFGGELWRGPIWWPEKGNLGRSTLVHYDRQVWSLMHPVEDSVFIESFDDRVREEIVEQFKKVGELNPHEVNTTKLDRIWAYRETGHVGAWVSAASGLLRVIPILFSKDIVNHVISLNYRFKVRNRMGNSMLSAYNPPLAKIEMEGRRMAEPLRIKNIAQSIAHQAVLSKKALNKLSEVVIGKTLFPQEREMKYASLELRRNILKLCDRKKLLVPSHMRSGYLYRPDQLRNFLDKSATKGFRYEEFLGRILTLEMAMRAVGPRSTS